MELKHRGEMKIKLTKRQMKKIRPLIDEVSDSFTQGKPVMLVGQIALRADEQDCMTVGIIPHEHALLFTKIQGYDADDEMKEMYSNHELVAERGASCS